MDIEKWGNSLKEKIRNKKVYRTTLESELMSQEWGAYHKRNLPMLEIPKEEGCHHLLFFPTSAPIVVEDRKKVLVTRECSGFDAIPVVFVMQCSDKVEFLFDLLPCGLNSNFPIFYQGKGKDRSIWDYRHPFSYFTFLPLMKIWNSPQTGMSTEFPFVSVNDLFIPVGNFFRIRGSDWLITSGSGDLKFARKLHEFTFINRTAENAEFRWIVPEKWQDKVYWELDEERTHRAEVSKNSTEKPVIVHIDKEVRERDEFLPTLVVAQSKNRIEWFPLPLFPEKK